MNQSNELDDFLSVYMTILLIIVIGEPLGLFELFR